MEGRRAGEVRKKIRTRENITEKNHAGQVTINKSHALASNESYMGNVNEKIYIIRLKNSSISSINFLMVRPFRENYSRD